MRRVGIMLLVATAIGACGPAAPESHMVPLVHRAKAASALFSRPGPSRQPRPRWKRRIDRLVRGRPMGVQVKYGGRALYARGSRNKRVPASNEKLLMTMALFDEVGPGLAITTDLAARNRRRHAIVGDLWVRGHGDPTVTTYKGGHLMAWSGEPTDLDGLVFRLKAGGVRRINGRVMAGTGYFRHDWHAPGWKPYFSAAEVALPSALTLNGNVYRGRHTSHPELVLARKLTRRLEARGISVSGRPGAGRAPRHLRPVAEVHSEPLSLLARYMNHRSSNFFAEVLGKRLSVSAYGKPGTIAAGARAIEAWARRQGVVIRAHDSSGLSYRNRASPRAIVRLLEVAEGRPWGRALRASLAEGGQGTLKHRLKKVKLRAKTGTLNDVSALSGWVWLAKRGDWAEFSILSRGLEKGTAVAIEDAVVRTVARSAG